MSEQVHQNINAANSDEIDLRELFSAIWAGKWIIIATTLLFSIAAVFYALSLPNVYKSEVTLAPAGESGGLNIPGQLGGLAALAGVNLGNNSGDKTALALEILKSREFLGRFIEENNLYIPLMATKGWERETNELIIDPKIYNSSAKKWVREVNKPFQSKPSVLETIQEFEKVIELNQNKETSIITLSIRHYSPIIAKEIAEKLVFYINEDVRSRDLKEAEKSMLYLNGKLNDTNVADVRAMLYSLIEEQTKKIMLANVREEYVLKVIDPAVVSEKNSSPNRVILIIVAFVIGLILSMIISIIKHAKRK